ncbi:MAG: DUF1566 domain-containing protein [Bacteroidaceae bacterium]|nr:DUF1566 domain-containing protein [Bacteroidaceae bacterium]
MKRILSFLLVAFMAIGVNAGNGNRTVTGAPYKVGDYYNDGIKEGIVFVVYDGGYHGKIVSVDESYELWAVSDVYKNATHATSKGDGMDNMRKIMKQPNWKKNYPAFAWCASLGEGWYLPALDELKLIYHKKSVINRRLDEREYYEIGEYGYWSSTEVEEEPDCAWYVNMNDGDSNYNSKNYIEFSVRAVSAF